MNRDAPIYYVRAVLDSSRSEGVRLDRINERILSVKFEDNERKADKLTLTLDNFDVAMYDEPAFKKGLILDVQWGYAGNMAPARRCVVQSIKGGLIVTVEALAQSILMNKLVRSRVFTNMRRSDIVRQIAREHGYSDETTIIQDTRIVYPELAQARMTDAQMIKSLADLEGYEFYVDHDGFHWHERRLDQPIAHTLRWYTDRTGEIQSFDLDNDITAKKARRRQRGRDPLEGQEIEGEGSDSSDTNAVSLGETIEVIDPESISFSSREATEADVRAASEDVEPTSAQDAESAQTEARGRFRQSKLVAIQLKLNVIGDPLLQAKQVVKVEGLGQRISGLYYVKAVTSTIDSSGFKQILSCVSNGSGGLARRSRLGDLELPSRGLPTRGNARSVEDDVNTALEHGALQEVQVLNPETNRYETVYQNSTGRAVARRTSSGRVVTTGGNS